MSNLKIGDKAPNLNIPNQSGENISLENYVGKKLVIFFYPKDMTPGCTAESCDLRDNYNKLLEEGYEVLGISCDNQKSHQKFIEKYNLPFDLASDEEQEVVKAYDVWGPKKFMGREYMGISRITYIIDENGVIEKVYEKVSVKSHARDILNDFV